MTITATINAFGWIDVVLDAGDDLAGTSGPRGLSVPVATDNQHYAALVARGIAIAPYVEPIAAVKAALLAAIDAEAEAERLKHMTPGAGQALVYREKADEAERCVADPAPKPESYPILAASIGIEAATLIDVARIVVARRAAWAKIAAAIETQRLGAKKAIDAATTADEARAAKTAVTWPGADPPSPPAETEETTS